MRAIPISSPHNTHIKSVIRLRQKSERDKTGLTIVEGERELMCAVSSGVSFHRLFYCPVLLKDKKIMTSIRRWAGQCEDVFEVTESAYQKIGYGHRGAGILAVVHQPQRSLTNLSLGDCPLVVIVEHLEKPGNLGAILRTADAVGVDAVIVCDALTDIYNPNVIRSSIGTVFSVPVTGATDSEVLEFLKAQKVSIWAASPQAKKYYSQVNWRKAAAVVVGNEPEGLSPFWLEKADGLIAIPMKGKADSLNVSVTAAVILFEAIRQRGEV